MPIGTEQWSLFTQWSHTTKMKIGKCGKSFVFVSDELSHNSTVVLAILEKLTTEMKSVVPDMKFIHYWTDSPTSQYRNKTIFATVANHGAEFGIPASWNYFEAGHGKGPCNGVGGSAKRMADEAVKRQKATIQDASDFYVWASQASSNSALKYFFYSKEDYSAAGDKIARHYSYIRTVPGTLKVHAVTAINREQVYTRATSCYCNTCLKKFQQSATAAESCEWMKFTLRDPNTASVNSQLSVAVGEWIASKYERNWFIGRIDVRVAQREMLYNFPEKFLGSPEEVIFRILNKGTVLVSGTPEEQILTNFGTFRYFSAKMRELFCEIEFQRIFERMFEAALSYKCRYFELTYESANKNSIEISFIVIQIFEAI